MPESDDSRLVARAADGDREAFAQLYGAYLPLVLRWCLRQTGNRELAADLSAEVFAASLIAACRYRGDNDDVLAWLLGIARNKLRESRRRGRRGVGMCRSTEGRSIQFNQFPIRVMLDSSVLS